MAGEKSDNGIMSFEDALDRTGYGLYSISHVVLTGAVIIAFACVTFNSALIVPTSACELETTGTQQGIIAAAPVVGVMLGGTPWGYLGDARGRRGTLILSLFMAAALNLVAALSVNWIMLFVVQFFVSFIAAAQFPLSMTLLSESVPLSKRNLSVLLVTCLFLLAQTFMAVIAMLIIPLSFSMYLPILNIYWNSWRTLLVVYSIPSLVTIIWLLFMPESPKYFYVKGKEDKAMEVLRTLHRRNRICKKEEDFNVTWFLKADQKDIDVASKNTLGAKADLKKPLLKYSIIMSILFLFEQVGSLQIWFPTIVNQFMRMVDTGAPMNQTLCAVLRSSRDTPPNPDAVPCSLNNNAMLLVIAVGALQSIANALVSLVLNSVGRRNMVIVVTTVCGLSGILVNLVTNTIASAVFCVILMIGYIVNGLYTALAVALFPTHFRALAIGLTISVGRLGNIAAIQILNYLLVNNCDAGFYTFSAIFAASAIAVLFLPDDRRQAKPDPHLKTDEMVTKF